MTPLSELQPGQAGIVRTLRGGHSFVSRLAALGFTPGAPLSVIRNAGSGPLIVSIRGTRVALGRGEAAHVLILRQQAAYGNASPSS